LKDEGDLTEEFKKELEKRRKSANYISHEEVKREFLQKNDLFHRMERELNKLKKILSILLKSWKTCQNLS